MPRRVGPKIWLGLSACAGIATHARKPYDALRHPSPAGTKAYFASTILHFRKRSSV
jgi:hypothetical protein